MKKKIALFCAALLVSSGMQVFASGQYDFTVRRDSGIKSEVLHARFKYGDINPGVEVARVIVSQRLKDADTKSIEVSSYDPNASYSSTDVPEFTVNFTGEQVQQLGEAAGRGDAAGVAVIATGIVVGVGTDVIKGAGQVAEDTKNFVDRTLGVKW